MDRLKTLLAQHKEQEAEAAAARADAATAQETRQERQRMARVRWPAVAAIIRQEAAALSRDIETETLEMTEPQDVTKLGIALVGFVSERRRPGLGATGQVVCSHDGDVTLSISSKNGDWSKKTVGIEEMDEELVRRFVLDVFDAKLNPIPPAHR